MYGSDPFPLRCASWNWPITWIISVCDLRLLTHMFAHTAESPHNDTYTHVFTWSKWHLQYTYDTPCLHNLPLSPSYNSNDPLSVLYMQQQLTQTICMKNPASCRPPPFPNVNQVFQHEKRKHMPQICSDFGHSLCNLQNCKIRLNLVRVATPSYFVAAIHRQFFW